MTNLLALLAGCALLPAADADKTTLRYLRPADDKFVLESEVTTTRDDKGTTYVSRTERGREKTTLTVRHDKAGKLTSAEVVVEAAAVKKNATAAVQDAAARVQRGGTVDFLKLTGDPVVTTAPDWSDVFQLVRRYDAAKGGKQEFPGLWFHPTNGLEQPTFTADRTGSDAVTAGGKELRLDRYRVKLRSGDYSVWADADRKVYKILPGGDKAVPVVLEGFEDATRNLK